MAGLLKQQEPWRILLVDDNEDDLYLIRDLLEEGWPGVMPLMVFTASGVELERYLPAGKKAELKQLPRSADTRMYQEKQRRKARRA